MVATAPVQTHWLVKSPHTSQLAYFQLLDCVWSDPEAQAGWPNQQCGLPPLRSWCNTNIAHYLVPACLLLLTASQEVEVEVWGLGGGRVAWSDTSAWVWGGCPASAKTLLLAAEGGREGSRRRWGWLDSQVMVVLVVEGLSLIHISEPTRR